LGPWEATLGREGGDETGTLPRQKPAKTKEKVLV